MARGRRRKFTDLWPINAVSITFHILFSALAISCVLVVVVFNRQLFASVNKSRSQQKMHLFYFDRDFHLNKKEAVRIFERKY